VVLAYEDRRALKISVVPVLEIRLVVFGGVLRVDAICEALLVSIPKVIARGIS